MIYRVIQRSDGLYKCQHRFAFFWWTDSGYPASRDKEDQIVFAKWPLPRPPQPTRVVWPEERQL